MFARIRRRGFAALLALLLACACASGARAQDVLVDTGAGAASGGSSLFHDGKNFNFFAGKFTLASDFTIGAVQGWMVRPEGTLNVKLRANTGANLPGAELESANFEVTFAGFNAQWTSFSGLQWTHPAGTYWICIEPEPGTEFGSMPGGAPNPLPATAYFTNGNANWVVFNPNVALGFRLLTPAPPEPIQVPGDYPTIQAAIDAALSGQIIDVAPGTYAEAINFSGKTITVRKAEGRGVATIDASGTGLRAVTIGFGSGSGTRLEGFTITGGSTTGGGGVFVFGATATIADCIITGNEAESGGGAAVEIEANATFENCTFDNNDADTSGGGTYVNSAQATFTDCAFNANHSGNGGGGLNVNVGGQATLSGCTFTANTSANAAGAAMIIGNTADATFNACAFNGNSALQAGAIMVNVGMAEFTECDFTGNTATFPGTTAGGAVQAQGGATLTLVSCTLTDNSAEYGGGVQLLAHTGAATLSQCVFESNDATTSGGGVYRGFGSTGPFTVVNTRFCENTPDAVSGAFIDGGGNQFHLVCNPPVGDANGDGSVNVADLVSVILAWGPCAAPPTPCAADANGDGVVNVSDLIAVILNWG